ncbi:NUDIX domain-containing protein [Candidatus Bathyarchaeota archaeon]|nr:NUDIX domain-containing protein [Candidatus Bathyarchaeota archaeon]
MRKQDIVVCTRAVIFNENHEVLVQHGLTSENDFYRLPGGEVTFQEKLEDCVAREIKEETGLNVKALRLLWVRDFLEESSYHSVELFFLANIEGGQLETGLEGSCERLFMTLEELENVVFYPRAFIPKLKLLRDNRNWTEEDPYVGSAK